MKSALSVMQATSEEPRTRSSHLSTGAAGSEVCIVILGSSNNNGRPAELAAPAEQPPNSAAPQGCDGGDPSVALHSHPSEDLPQERFFATLVQQDDGPAPASLVRPRLASSSITAATTISGSTSSSSMKRRASGGDDKPLSPPTNDATRKSVSFDGEPIQVAFGTMKAGDESSFASEKDESSLSSNCWSGHELTPKADDAPSTARPIPLDAFDGDATGSSSVGDSMGEIGPRALAHRPSVDPPSLMTFPQSLASSDPSLQNPQLGSAASNNSSASSVAKDGTRKSPNAAKAKSPKTEHVTDASEFSGLQFDTFPQANSMILQVVNAGCNLPTPPTSVKSVTAELSPTAASPPRAVDVAVDGVAAFSLSPKSMDSVDFAQQHPTTRSPLSGQLPPPALRKPHTGNGGNDGGITSPSTHGSSNASSISHSKREGVTRTVSFVAGGPTLCSEAPADDGGDDECAAKAHQQQHNESKSTSSSSKSGTLDVSGSGSGGGAVQNGDTAAQQTVPRAVTSWVGRQADFVKDNGQLPRVASPDISSVISVASGGSLPTTGSNAVDSPKDHDDVAQGGAIVAGGLINVHDPVRLKALIAARRQQQQLQQQQRQQGGGPKLPRSPVQSSRALKSGSTHEVRFPIGEASAMPPIATLEMARGQHEVRMPLPRVNPDGADGPASSATSESNEDSIGPKQSLFTVLQTWPADSMSQSKSTTSRSTKSRRSEDSQNLPQFGPESHPDARSVVLPLGSGIGPLHDSTGLHLSTVQQLTPSGSLRRDAFQASTSVNNASVGTRSGSQQLNASRLLLNGSTTNSIGVVWDASKLANSLSVPSVPSSASVKGEPEGSTSIRSHHQHFSVPQPPLVPLSGSRSRGDSLNLALNSLPDIAPANKGSRGMPMSNSQTAAEPPTNPHPPPNDPARELPHVSSSSGLVRFIARNFSAVSDGSHNSENGLTPSHGGEPNVLRHSNSLHVTHVPLMSYSSSLPHQQWSSSSLDRIVAPSIGLQATPLAPHPPQGAAWALPKSPPRAPVRRGTQAPPASSTNEQLLGELVEVAGSRLVTSFNLHQFLRVTATAIGVPQSDSYTDDDADLRTFEVPNQVDDTVSASANRLQAATMGDSTTLGTPLKNMSHTLTFEPNAALPAFQPMPRTTTMATPWAERASMTLSSASSNVAIAGTQSAETLTPSAVAVHEVPRDPRRCSTIYTEAPLAGTAMLLQIIARQAGEDSEDETSVRRTSRMLSNTVSASTPTSPRGMWGSNSGGRRSGTLSSSTATYEPSELSGSTRKPSVTTVNVNPLVVSPPTNLSRFLPAQ